MRTDDVHDKPHVVAIDLLRISSYEIGAIIDEIHEWLDDNFGKGQWAWTHYGIVTMTIHLYTIEQAVLFKLRFGEYT